MQEQVLRAAVLPLPIRLFVGCVTTVTFIIIQSLRAFRRAGKGAKRKVVSDGRGARVEGKEGMRAKVEGPCNGG